MRYYDIVITDPVSGKQIKRFTSYVNGKTDPGALDIEIDLPVASFAQPMGSSGAFVRIWGISLQDIGQASNLNGMRIAVSGGMQKGLPLANPQQSGLLVAGTIFQAFGNWIGINQTLDLQLVAEQGTSNLPVSWKAGTKLVDAITATLKTGFPDYTADIQISDNLVFGQDITAHYNSLVTFAQFIRLTSASILNPTTTGGQSRAGVDIVLRDKKFIVRDDTTPRVPKQIAFTDLMGQPTWYAPETISISTVMRADIGILDFVKLPPTPMTTLPQSQSQARNKSVFQGVFKIFEMRHVGRFRQPTGEAWMTTYGATTVPKQNPSVTTTDLPEGG